jgi:hypothetical protein
VARRCLLLLLVLLTAAGTAFAANNPHDPQKRFTAADQAWAKRISIGPADLPGGGWKATRTNDDSNTCKAFNPDESHLVETGERQSPDYTRGGGFVASGSTVYRSAGDAQTAWNLEVKPAMLACLDEGFKQAAASGMRVTILSRARLPFPQLAPRTAAFRVRVRYDVQNLRIPASLDVVVLGGGRVDAGLFLQSPGSPLQPLPSGLERTLAARLAARLSH